MTHTLHRRGTAENLRGDYVILMQHAVGINDADYIPTEQKFLRMALHHNPVNIGTDTRGNMYSHRPEEVIGGISEGGDVHAVFDNPQDLIEFLKELKEADLGLSVVVSGLFDKVDECLKVAGLKHHTANFSLGIWGKTDLLPGNNILEITTMCGHGLISASLVRALVEDVKAGRKTPEEAAKALPPNCTCGIFNPVRAARLLAAMAE
jgi:hypothetical protein